MTIQDLSARIYSPIGRCVYCDSSEGLTREHIVPFGLSGTAVLPDASCERCARITGAVERDVLRGVFWPVRVIRRLRTRRPGAAPDSEVLQVERNGCFESIELPLESYPVLLPMPLFELPASLGGPVTERGILLRGVQTISFGPKPEQVALQLGVRRLRLDRLQQPIAFARMLAKIALCYSVGELGISRFRKMYVRGTILGSTDDVGQWVGTLNDIAPVQAGLLHRLALHIEATTNRVLVEVQLFADSQTPSYIVAVGESFPHAA